MKAVFISDLHLSPKTEAENNLFCELLVKWVDEIDCLYILGDFFDYWLGDDDSNDFIIKMKTALKKFTLKKPIYFIVGNHDFMLGRRFARATGIKLLKDNTIIDIDGKRLLISHGDVFCSLDVTYQRMKKILQSKLFKFIMNRFTPLSFRYKIKEKLELSSANKFNTKPDYVYDVVDDTILKYIKNKRVDIVIHGHTHKMGIYDVVHANSLKRIVIPDWVDHKMGGYVLLDQGQINIC